MQDLDEMKSDTVLEVLDTPDRFARPVSLSSSDRKLEPARMTYARRCRDFGSPHKVDSSSSAPDDTEFFFRQATLARMVPDCCTKIDNNESRGLLSVGSSRPARLVARSGTVISLKPPVSPCKEERTCSPDGNIVGLKGRDKREGTELAPSRSLQLNVPRKTMAERKLVRGGCISPPNRAKADIPSEIDGQDKGKAIDLCRESQPRTGHTHLRPLQLGVGACPRNTGQRRLVRNGCISQNNIARSKNVTMAKEDEAGNMVFGEPVNGISSHQIHIVSPDSEGRCADKKKKQVVVDENEVTSDRHAKAKFQSSRGCLALGKEVTVIVDMDGDAVRSEDIDGRTAHKIIALQNGSESKRENLLKGKRKYSSTRSTTGECSGSTFDDSISYGRSSRQPSHSKSTGSCNSRHPGSILGPVIEIDEMHSPEAVRSNPREESTRISDDVNARAIQLEADEILAYQLQEKFYNESPVIGGTDEIDATIALSLQEEDAQRSISRQDQFHGRDASIAHPFARPRNYTARSTNRVTSTRMAQLRRNFHQWRMDLDTRLNLEVREPARDSNNGLTISNRVLRVQRDFNENDYEMLLALDDNNRHGGASESQINSLPQSVVETDNLEEPCVVCLEPHVTGDTIRHLPCLHNFHKECIDAWLRKRRLCPICKSGIT